MQHFTVHLKKEKDTAKTQNNPNLKQIATNVPASHFPKTAPDDCMRQEYLLWITKTLTDLHLS